MVSFGKWVLAGAVGGLAGGTIWALIAYFAHAEIGWIAWGIGAVVGVCVRFVAGESEEGWGPGLTAALIAILAVLGGKFAAVSMIVASLGVSGEGISLTDEQMISGLADEIVHDRLAKGQKVMFPLGKSVENATAQADYPSAIWQTASNKWKTLGATKQAELRAEKEAEFAAVLGMVGGELRSRAFAESFSLYDALWFFLAAATAFKLGAGNVGSEDD